jgi:DNA-directed RNA polymerase subunit M/transcription elongation factor TFIIS
MTTNDIDFRELAFEKIKTFVDLPDEQAHDLEKGIYNWTIEFSNANSIFLGWKNDVFTKLYNNKLITMLNNLDADSELQNTNLLKRLKNKEFKPHELPFMAPYEIFPERWMAIINKKLKKDQSVLDSDVASQTDLFKCGKCKQRKCSYYEMQVRSADESATLFISCLNCKHKWRIG